jgi:GST-like protein
MNDTTTTAVYTPPTVWSWNKDSGGRFANINRPIAGATQDKDLPVGSIRCSSIRWRRPTA